MGDSHATNLRIQLEDPFWFCADHKELVWGTPKFLTFLFHYGHSYLLVPKYALYAALRIPIHPTLS